MHEIRKPVVSDTHHTFGKEEMQRVYVWDPTKGHIEEAYSSLAIEQRRSFQGLTKINIVSM